jgi:hypothetical protein
MKPIGGALGFVEGPPFQKIELSGLSLPAGTSADIRQRSSRFAT